MSNYEVYHLVELLEYAKVSEFLNLMSSYAKRPVRFQHIPTVNQFEFHPYFTRQTLVHYCEQNGIFVQVRSVSLFYRLGQEAVSSVLIRNSSGLSMLLTVENSCS